MSRASASSISPMKRKRQVIILRIDPARPGQAAAHHGKRFADMPRDFKTCEQTGHDTCGPKSARISTNRSSEQHAVIACACNPHDGCWRSRTSADQLLPPSAGYAATMTSTPAAFGCRPSCCFKAEVAGNAVEEERIEQRAVFGGKLGINAFERLRVIRPEIGRRAHAAEKHGDVAFGQALQDCVKRLARHLRLDAAQHVVGAEFEDDGVGAFRHRPIEPRQPPEAVSPETPALAISAAMPLAASAACSRGTKPSRSRQAETRGQRVAERHDLDRRGVAHAPPEWRLRATKRNATNSRMHDVAQTFRRPHMIVHEPIGEGTLSQKHE